MSNPSDRKYSKTHEWFQVNGDTVTIGITQFAADELTDITYVELPAPGTQVTAGKPFGEIESVKTTSELYSAVTGQVIESNAALKDDPGVINSDPFNKGWMIRVKVSDASGLESLMDAAAYQQMTSQ